MEESEAIGRLKKKDITGLEGLVNLYQRRALRAAQLICRNRTQAEDIVQGAFLQAYDRIDQFDASRPFEPWFLRIVVNTALMSVRSHKKITPENDALELIAPDLYHELEAADLKETIWATLDRLSPEQRAAVILHYYADLSNTEIAQTLNCPPGTVRRRLHDARQNLRRLLPTWVRPGN